MNEFCIANILCPYGVTPNSCCVSLSSRFCMHKQRTNEICLHKSVANKKKRKKSWVANFVRGILLRFEMVFTVCIMCVIVFLFHCFKQQKAGVVKWDQVWPLLKKINVNLICLVFMSHSYSVLLFLSFLPGDWIAH